MDYRYILYHQPYNESLNSKLKSIQYNFTLTITETIKGTSRSKTYKELQLESLNSQRSLTRLCAFCKIISTHLPIYLFNLITNQLMLIKLELRVIFQHTNIGRIPFFHQTVVQWNKVYADILNASITVFKKLLLKKYDLILIQFTTFANLLV